MYFVGWPCCNIFHKLLYFLVSTHCFTPYRKVKMSSYVNSHDNNQFKRGKTVFNKWLRLIDFFVPLFFSMFFVAGIMNLVLMTHPMLPNFMIAVERKTQMRWAALPISIFPMMMIDLSLNFQCKIVIYPPCLLSCLPRIINQPFNTLKILMFFHVTWCQNIFTFLRMMWWLYGAVIEQICMKGKVILVIKHERFVLGFHCTRTMEYFLKRGKFLLF